MPCSGGDGVTPLRRHAQRHRGCAAVDSVNDLCNGEKSAGSVSTPPQVSRDSRKDSRSLWSNIVRGNQLFSPFYI